MTKLPWICLAVLLLAGVTFAQPPVFPATRPANGGGDRALVTKAYDLNKLLVAAPQGDSERSSAAAAFDPSRQLQEFAELLQATVAPESWSPAGASIRLDAAHKSPLVTQTPGNQGQVQSVLAGLDKDARTLLTLELRLLSFDGSEPKAQQALDEALNKSNLLDRDAYHALLKSAQAIQGAAVITAPRVTIFNGGQARVEVSASTSYVNGLTPDEKDAGPVQYTPEIATVEDGLALEVALAASPDREQVTLRISQQINRLLGISPFVFAEHPQKLILQQPQTEEVTFHAQAVIPKGKVAFLGRVQAPGKALIEGETPKIPMLDRLKPDLYLFAVPTVITADPTTRPAEGPSSEPLVTRVYEVADLLVQIAATNAKTPAAPTAEEMKKAAEDLREQVLASVAAESWKRTDNGARVLRFSPSGTQLVVRQTPAGHETLQALLNDARADRSRQVAVDVWFITADTQKLNSVIGMDLSEEGRIPQLQAASRPDAPRPEFSGSYLDDRHLRFILDHLADVDGQILASPSLLALNGATAEIRSLQVQRYVAAPNATTRPSGEPAYQLENSGTQQGVILTLRPKISDDGKRITLYLNPQLLKTLEIAPFRFRPEGAEHEVTLQEPRTQEISVETLIGIPDGQTLVLGGQTLSPGPDATTRPAGSQTLLILARPRILRPE